VMNAARRLWQMIEPYHAVTCFSPEARRVYEEAGLRGFWRGYFAGRSAPLGAVGASAVTAMFFGFHPDFVGRALPSVWSMLQPASAVDARIVGADAALRAALGELVAAPELEAAGRLVRHAVSGCNSAGRPLFAANRDLSWPEEPHLALWHGATLLREHRGDGHVAALVHAGLDGAEAHVARVAETGDPVSSIRPYRGWSDEDWANAIERLRVRGWIGADARLTARGRAVRAEVEADTDRLAASPVDTLGAQDLERLLMLLRPFVSRLAEDLIPYPNPMGVPPISDS
jgi:Helix-turn-helix family